MNTTKPDAYFISGDWKKKVKEREHKELLIVNSFKEAQALLYGEAQERKVWQLMQPARGALMNLKPNELA